MGKSIQRSDTCRICGRPLEETDQELCRACRMMETAKARYDQQTDAATTEKRPRRRMNGTTRMMLILVCVLAVIFVGLVAASNILYERYSPDRFFSTLDAALAAGDAKALMPLLTGDDLIISEEGAAALCLAFSDAGERAALAEQLAAQVVDANAAGAYPALRLVKTRAVLGYGSYALGVKSVSLLLQAPAREVRLALDGTPRQGEQTADGLVYRNIFPGQYVCAVTGVTAAGQPVSGGATPLRLFGSDEPTVFDGALPVASVTVSGCVSDDAVISVDGITVTQKPENGVVTLPQVAVGSVISMRYTAPWGAVTVAQTTVGSAGESQLEFTGHLTQGGIPTAETLTPLLNVFFGTYLDALNRQDASLISGCTEACRAAMNAADGSEYQTGHVFSMESVVCAPLIESETVDGMPRVTCVGRFAYKIVNRETSEERDLVDYARCTFCWQDGWKLDVYTLADEPAFTAASADAQG